MQNSNNSRRGFLKLLGLSPIAAMSLVPTISKAAPIKNNNIIIIGGGFSGATCAKYLKLWGGNSVNVTIIEKNSTYVSPILSNLVLNSQKTTKDLTFTYSTLKQKYKINFIHENVIDIDKANKKLTLSNSKTVKYDQLVLATGIDFEKVNEYDFKKVPHAWQSRDGINDLKAKIESMRDGDTFIMSIPSSPYRCPPGPYERACVVADYLKNKKRFYNSKVIVLDANSKIIVKEDTFGAEFRRYGIDYRPNSIVTKVDESTNSVTFEENGVTKRLSAKVLNIIPNQKAAPIVFKAQINSGKFAPVNPLSYESLIANDIYIIGDSQATSQPKAGHIGNSEAKICADAILRKLNNIALYPSPKTNSACYSPVSSTKASWLSAVYRYDPVTSQMVLAFKDSGQATTKNYKKMFLWSENLFADTFA